MKYSIASILILFVLATSCQNQNSDGPAPGDDGEEEELVNHFGTLINRMIGSFDSKEQSEADTTYYNISLHMYPIWEDQEEDGIAWLYVEQALADMQDKPYRQRVYKVEELETGKFKSSIYTINDQDNYVGAWKDVRKFDTLNMDSISLREGCAVFLNLDDVGNFVGETDATSCKSSLRGASYATSEVAVYDNKIISWDRGFDENGEHVWGAEKAGYIFNKIKGRYDEIYKAD